MVIEKSTTSEAEFHEYLKNSAGRPTMPAMGDFGTYVRNRRRQLGLTLDSLATRSGVTLQAISQIELGRTKNIKAVTVIGLARGLDVEPAELLGLLESEGERELALV